MNPSPACIAYILAQSPNWAQSNAQIAAALNAATVANPVGSAPQVPRPFTAADLVGACSQANRANLNPNLAGAAATLIITQQAALLGEGLDALAAMGLITAGDAAAMKAVMAQTEADPTWTATLPAPLVALGRLLDQYDIAAARPEG